MGAYILDGMRFKEGAFTAVWATLVVAHLALVYNSLFLDSNDLPLLLALMALAMCALTLFLIGVWATLQFKWIQLQHPAVAVAFEKMLIIGSLPIAAAMQAWGIASSTGMDTAPFFLAALMCVLYYLFALPLTSSFIAPPRRTSMGGAAVATPPCQGKSDAFSAFLVTLTLPAAVYFAVHSGNIFQWVHLWSLLLVGSGPLLFVASIKDGLWWLGTSAAADALRSLFVLLALGGFLAGIEGRIIFHSFGQYIRLAEPWSYIAITLALYSVGALGLLYVSGALGEDAASALMGPVIMVSSSIGGLVMGLPIWVLPAPLLASAGLALFFDSRSFKDYLVFVVGALATGGWFLWKHFWFLKDIHLDGMPLRTLCILLGAAMLPALIIPGLWHSGAKNSFIAVPLLIQAGLMCVIEETLFAGDHTAVTYNVHPMFPSFLVIATSAAGLALARRLSSLNTISPVESYLLQCAYGAKLAMLVVPEAKLMVPVLGVLLAITPPLLVDSHSSGSIVGSSSDLHLRRRSQLLPWQGAGLATAVIFAVIAARYAIFDMLHMLLNRRPSEALATGVLLLAASLGCIPLVSRYYKGSQQAKRALLLTAAAGLLLMLLRPPLPVSGGAKCPKMPFGLCPRLWNERHAPEHEEDDVSIYGDGLRRREHWPLWLLAGAAFSGLVAATSPPARQIAPLRLGEATAAAVLVAGYMALEFFPGMPLVQAVIGSSALLAALAVVLIQVPSKSGKILLPVIILAWAALLPGALMVQVVSSLPPLPAEAHRLLPDFAEGVEIEEERQTAVRSAIFASFAAESLLLAFALKLRVATIASGLLPASVGGGGGLAGSGRSSVGIGFSAAAGMQAIDRAADFLGQCMPAYALQPGAAKPFLKGPASAAMQRLTTEGMAWAPTACNVVTLLCFSLCIILNNAFTESSPWGVVILSPVLLLLCQDPVLFRNLTDQRRYFPPTAITGVLLLGTVFFEVYNDVFGLGYYELLTGDWFDITKNVVFALFCVPSLVDLLWFMWNKHRLTPVRALVPAVVASVGIIMADFEATQLLAGVCAAGGVYLAATAQQTRQAGRKLI
jgi:hypothetical protein